MAARAEGLRRLIAQGVRSRGALRLPVLIAFLFLPLLTGCQSMLPQVKPPLQEEGEVLLYVEPFPQEADRLRFGIEAISARRDDGGEFPVASSFRRSRAGR